MAPDEALRQPGSTSVGFGVCTEDLGDGTGGGKQGLRVHIRLGITTERLPYTRPLYIQVSKGGETEQFGGPIRVRLKCRKHERP